MNLSDFVKLVEREGGFEPDAVLQALTGIISPGTDPNLIYKVQREAAYVCGTVLHCSVVLPTTHDSYSLTFDKLFPLIRDRAGVLRLAVGDSFRNYW